jgi:hypothetical protein
MFGFFEKDKKLKKFHQSMVSNGKTDLTWKRVKTISSLYNFYEDELIRKDVKDGVFSSIDDVNLTIDYIRELKPSIQKYMIENNEATQKELNYLSFLKELDIVRLQNE